MWEAKERQGAQMPPGYFDTHAVRNTRGLERSEGASHNLTKNKAEVQRITKSGRKAAWVDDL